MLSKNLPNIKDDLINILCGIPQLQDKVNRDALLFNLPRNIITPITRSNNPVADLSNLIGTLDAFGQLDTGEWPLVKLIQNAQRYCPPNTEQGRCLQELRAQYEPSLDKFPIEPIPEILVWAEDNRLPIDFLEKALRAQKSVARLLVPRIINGQPSTGNVKSVTGTGWLISSNLLLTNYHVIEARFPGENPASDAEVQAQAKATVAWFGYNSLDAVYVDYCCRDLVKVSKPLDYALLRFEESPSSGQELPLSEWRHLSVVRSQPQMIKGIRLNIIQHPQGEHKKLAIRSNYYVGKISTSDQPSRIQYLTDTEPGASGSPVFDDNWQVVALHHASLEVPASQYKGEIIKYNNQGIEIHAILDDIQQEVRSEIQDFQGWDE